MAFPDRTANSENAQAVRVPLRRLAYVMAPIRSSFFSIDVRERRSSALENFTLSRVAKDRMDLSTPDKANQVPLRLEEVIECFNRLFTRTANVVVLLHSSMCKGGCRVLGP